MTSILDLHPANGYVRPASIADALYVAKNLRDEDRDEVRALAGMDPRVVLPAYVQEGREVLVAGFVEQPPQIIFGVDPVWGLEDEAAVIWMLSTPEIYKHAQVFVPYSKQIWDAYNERYPILTNFTDCRNTRHHTWLKWLGAKFIRRVDSFGAESRPFYEFVSYRPSCA